MDVLKSPGEMFRDRFVDVDFRMSPIHRAQSQCGSNAAAVQVQTCTKLRYLRNREGTSGGPVDVLFIQSLVGPSTVTSQSPR